MRQSNQAETKVIKGHVISTNIAEKDLPRNEKFLGDVSRIQRILNDKE